MIIWLASMSFVISALSAVGAAFAPHSERALGIVLAVLNLLAGIWLLADGSAIL